MPASDFHAWLSALESRHLADLDFSEVRRGVQALSARYVERRGRIRSGGVLDGAGKRAAFALFYGPLHFLVVSRIVRELGADRPPLDRVIDLGCGTGVAGAAWASCCPRRPELHGYDIHPWAVQETRWNYRELGLRGRATRSDVARARLAGAGSAVVAAYTVNELDNAGRDTLLENLLRARRQGAAILVVEPIARRPVPWWDTWSAPFREAGGRDDTWRWSETLPDLLARLDRASSLDHTTLTARSLYLPPVRPG